jgi:FixJ family two-component response regulator
LTCHVQEATKLAGEMSSEDPEVGLRAVASLRALVDSVEELQVENARAHGWTWQQIATALGISKQAVHQKHAARGRLFRRAGR